ncbi:hypothetical protein [Enterococcus lactis]|uniref:hypothetical protein n=1 Tax=Enterococcus lactis TaxID=357441 RepID=UPI002412C096|nr:hypothetical protein [Enterococcus lactis]
MKQVLEALEQIRKAEEENEKRARTLRQQLKTYAEEKEQELEIIQINNRQQLKQLVEEKEQFEKQELEKEKIKLKAEADKVQATLKDQYQKHQSQAIGAIIERVKETYGRH